VSSTGAPLLMASSIKAGLDIDWNDGEQKSEALKQSRLAFRGVEGRDQRMDEFIRKHAEVIRGVLSCFDRMLFRGYLPIMSGYAMATFLQARGVHRWGLKAFLLTQVARLKKHAMDTAAAAGRPYQYLGERTRKEDLAREMAERDRIDEGLICVFALLEVSRTFSLAWKERTPFVQSTRGGRSKVVGVRRQIGLDSLIDYGVEFQRHVPHSRLFRRSRASWPSSLATPRILAA